MELATSIFLAIAVPAVLLTLPVIVSARLMGAEKQPFSVHFVTVIIAMIVQAILVLALSNSIMFILVSIMMNGIIFSSRLNISFIKGLVVAILSLVIFTIIMSVTGILDVDFFFEFHT